MLAFVGRKGEGDIHAYCRGEALEEAWPLHQQRTDIKGTLEVEFARGRGIVNAV